MKLFDAKKITAINKICSPRVTTQFMAKQKNYKRVGNKMLEKWCMRGNSLVFDNKPEYNGVVKIIMHLGPVFAN